MKKRWIAGACVMLLASGLLSGCGAGGHKNAGQAAGDQPVKAFDVSDVTAFTYVYQGQLLMYDLEGDTWQNMADASVKLDKEKIEDFLQEMSGMTAQTVIEDAGELSEYGLDDPGQMFAAVFSDGSSLTYCFGTEDEKASGVYLQVTDDKDAADNTNVYLVDETYVTDTLNRGMEEFE